jgi:hypothetical protein
VLGREYGVAQQGECEYAWFEYIVFHEKVLKKWTKCKEVLGAIQAYWFCLFKSFK